MASLPLVIWIGIGVMALAGLLAVLYTLAETIRCETYVHDVKAKANRLRLQYAAQLASEQDEEVIVVDEAPAEEGDEGLRKAA